ncbi:hypothetical protein [Sphingobacterium cavernae]|uniref:hypothetical protein n=1 Tax=Sphingobacterium cavernae TaxID=2592657 RepID=UPI00122FCEA9|nr:hypothetical protein [Sphingobacterium cavernae]
MNIVDNFREMYSFQSCIGLEVDINLSEQILSTYIERKAKSINIKDFNSFNNIKEVAEYVQNIGDALVSLYVKGKGILIKSIESLDPNKSELSEKEIQNLLPSYTTENFYNVQFKGKDKIWLAIVKRQPVDDLLNSLRENNILPIQVFIGPFGLSNILKQINIYNNSYIFHGHRIETDENGEWISYDFSVEHQNPFNIKVGNKTISHEYLSSYAAAFSTLLYDFLPNLSLTKDDLEFQFLEAKEKIKLNLNSKIVLGVLFILLVTSTIFFHHYYQQNQQLSNSISTQNISEKQLEELIKQTRDQEQKLKQLGWNGGISKAWLLDQLGISLNDSPAITLTNIAINPSQEKRVGHQIDTEIDNRNTIRLSGFVYSLESLNSWIRKLNQTKWIETVRITKYTKAEKKADEENKNIFEAEIKFGYDF